MSYETAVASMFALGHELAHTPSNKFDLAHMRVLLNAMKHRERQFPAVLIAGTNGKGSTAATLASILQASGLKTALYTSPHLMRINERIRINGQEISDDDFARLHGEVDRIAERLVERRELPWHPSFFEMMTAIAFAHFAREKVEIAVLEVGMGGRLDATNVVEPLVSVIADISLDHQKFLGNTVGEIAREKVGIIRPGGVVVTLPQQPEANDVIGNTILDLGARGVSAVQYVPPVSPGSSEYRVPSGHKRALTAEDGKAKERAENGGATYFSGYPLQVMGKQILVESPLVGRHQLRNVALAIAAAEELAKAGLHGIAPESIEKGIRQTRWSGRFQVVPAKPGWPDIVFDVAHNPAGAWALRSALSERYENRPLIFVFAAMRDKAISEMTEILFPLAERIIATKPENPRAALPEEIHQAGSRTGAEIETASDVGAALVRARALSKPQAVIVVTGSIYLVGEAMRLLRVEA
ncbi:MAG TPA: folylpolyglutamate synthase/dihydrofolate synthase family protein [Candidatus Sulfotelmatobacter sp.]|jgi:dihydrofolate synthase/folylpolyglutamate synthase|nr:folylpolyglutamate synthase/dihydrofolate synthase family protein [Candidatus Sulfotelmatobacter sp.]